MTRIALALAALLVPAAAADRRGVGAAVDSLDSIRTRADFELVAVEDPASEAVLTTRWLLPARDDTDLLPPVFQNVHRFLLHQQFLAAKHFPGLTEEEYYALVARRSTRRYFAGTLSLYHTPTAGEFYGFEVFTDPADRAELLRVDEVEAVRDALAAVFLLRPLHYAPIGAAREVASSWRDPPFPVYLGGVTESRYVAYTRAVGYGRVRVLTLADFEEGNTAGLFTWQDILVLEESPADIEGVVAGVVTAAPQLGELSHLAVRTARRGTPNAYLAGAIEVFSPLEGELIRLETRREELTHEPATPAAAEAWWKDHRPRISGPVEVDESLRELEGLLELDVVDPAAAVARVGGKAANFALLQQAVFTGAEERYREAGFAVPVAHYLDFMRGNVIEVGGETVSYEEHLRRLLGSAEFRSDSRARFDALAAFREHAREHGIVSPSLVAHLAARIHEVFGSTAVAVRFRSSSNVEDRLDFSAAGLHESTTACGADSFDGEDRGPSRCDPSERDERTIDRALKRVWTSLWTFRAHEERAWYQVPQERVAMGILVTRAFLDEAANGVAFTGNPASACDGRYLVTAQKGEASVVRPSPGVFPERTFLEIGVGGEVARIDRRSQSSLVAEGEHVLSDDALRELGRVLAVMERRYPVDPGEHDPGDVLLDVEFKLERDGALAVKQVRPFLAARPTVPAPVLDLAVPEGAVACSTFGDSRSPAEELALKSRVTLRPGVHLVPTDCDAFELDLVEAVLFGPGRERAAPETAGRMEVSFRLGETGAGEYVLEWRQGFRLPAGETLEVQMETRVEAPQDGEVPPLVFDDAFLTDGVVLAVVPGGDLLERVRCVACGLPSRPEWDVRAELADGSTLRIVERMRCPVSGSEPVALTAATVRLGGEERTVDEAFDLVYAAAHHNLRPRYLVVIDPPVELPGEGPVHAVELRDESPVSGGSSRLCPPENVAPVAAAEFPAAVSYLGEGLDALSEPEVVFAWKGRLGEEPSRGFRRGDADASGRVDITDAIAILVHLFPVGQELPFPRLPCADAADFDDDGAVELADPVILLSYLFRGARIVLPPGPDACGRDPTEDFLDECEYGACR